MRGATATVAIIISGVRVREHTSLKYMYITSVHLHVICTSLYMSMLVWYLHHAGHAITSRPAWSQRVPMSSIQYTCMLLLSAPILKCVGSSVNKSKSIRLKFKRSWFETQLDLKFFLPLHTCTCICIAFLCIPHTHTVPVSLIIRVIVPLSSRQGLPST